MAISRSQLRDWLLPGIYDTEGQLTEETGHLIEIDLQYDPSADCMMLVWRCNGTRPQRQVLFTRAELDDLSYRETFYPRIREIVMAALPSIAGGEAIRRVAGD